MIAIRRREFLASLPGLPALVRSAAAQSRLFRRNGNRAEQRDGVRPDRVRRAGACMLLLTSHFDPHPR